MALDDFGYRTIEWLEQQRQDCLEIMRNLKKKDARRSEYSDRFATLTREINKRSGI